METQNLWNDGRCMSYVNKEVDRRCLNRCKNKDFCSKHNNKKQYYNELLTSVKSNAIILLNIDIDSINQDIKMLIEDDILNNLSKKINDKNQYLDNEYNHNLMSIYDSWSETNFSDQIFIDGEYWDINILANIITYQLNNTTMENPYPSYPNNPFNRKPFTPEAISIIKTKIIKLNKCIHITLKALLSQSKKYIEKIYNSITISNKLHSQNLSDLLKKKFRFMIINNKNSQNLYNGIWVPKKYPQTEFEIIYNSLKNMPYQIIYLGNIIENPQRQYISYNLSLYKGCDIDLLDNKFCEKL
jgi:hypothetical protein